MVRLFPLLSRIMSRVSSARKFEQIASRVIQIAPSSTRQPMPAISLPNEIDRVRQFEPTNSPQVHFDRLFAKVQNHGPTMAYLIDNALLHHGTLYSRLNFWNFTRNPKKFRQIGDCNFIDEAQLASSPLEHIYFGHWLHDTLPLEMLAYDRGVEAVRPKDPPWMHSPGYRDALDMRPRIEEHARISKLWVIDDRGLNENWSDRFLRVRIKLRSGQTPSMYRKVFISRGSSGSRREIANLKELQESLEKEDFFVLYPEKESSSTIISVLSGASVVVGMVGSALAHAQLAMPQGSSLVVIQPSNLFSGFHKLFADVSGIRFAFVVADTINDESFVDIPRLLKTIELVD